MTKKEQVAGKLLEFQGTLPIGVVLVHEIFGITDYTHSVARQLSEKGYHVVAVDLFGGKTISSLNQGLQMASTLERKDVLLNLKNGRDHLHSEIGPDALIGSMGFCMGGGYALLGACNLDFDFCVDYYGMIQNADEVERLSGPVQLILGADDPRVPPWAYANLLPAMTKYQKRIDVHLYPHAQHAFHRPGWEGHNTEAAEDAWEKTIRFLNKLGSE